MADRTRHLVRPLLVACAVCSLAWGLIGGATASAGGWAMGSLDSVPEARAGETEVVGFTILQHGVRPADLTNDPSIDNVGIEIVAGDGTTSFFPAAGDGAPGHYAATVTFPPTAGPYTWILHMGWFPEQELGTLHVAPADAGGGFGVRTSVPWVLSAVAAVLGTIAVGDLMRSHRRRAVRAPS